MRLSLSLDFAFAGALLLALPNLTRPDMLFGVPVPAGFRNQPEARSAILRFRLAMLFAIVLSIAGLLLAPDSSLGFAATAGPFALTIAAGIAFYTQYRCLSPFAVQFDRPRSVELTGAPDRLPKWALLGAVPFVLLAGAALYLSAHWNQIPATFPVHWSIDGRPNRWVERTPRAVFGFSVFGALVSFYLLFMAFACWFGSRRSQFRRVVFGALVASACMIGAMFSSIALFPLIRIPIGFILAIPIVFAVTLVVFLAKAAAGSSEPPEVTPNECWIFGAIYFNRNDAALFVQRRFGIGYTPNFANPVSWVILLGILPVIGSAIFLV